MTLNFRTIMRPQYETHRIRGVAVGRVLCGFVRRSVPASILPLDQLRALPRPRDIHAAGIYFLWRGPQLVYIGRSTNIDVRLSQHASAADCLRSGKIIPHNFANAFNAPENEIAKIERAYIAAYLPPFNDKIG